MKMFSRLILSAVAGCLAVQSATAAFVTPTTWSRPANVATAATTLTTYQAWDFVNSTTGPNPPNSPNVPSGAVVDQVPANPNGVANIFDTSGQSILTSGYNLYSPVGNLNMHLTVPSYNLGAGHQTKFILQIKTLGSDLVRTSDGPPVVDDFSHFKLDGTPIASLADFSYTELSRAATSTPFGPSVTDEHEFTFTAPTSASSYEITWDTLQSSTSQDRISVDTQTVPEPASLGMVGIGVTALLARRRRREA